MFGKGNSAASDAKTEPPLRRYFEPVEFVEMVGVGIFRPCGESKIWQVAEQRGQGDLEFEPGQRGSDAKMQAATKCCMGFHGASGIKVIGFVKERWVAPRSAKQ